MVYWAIAAFVLLSAQGLLTVLQVKSFQKAIAAMRGKGLLGIGSRRGVLRSGQILILSYDRATDKINNCMRMLGITIFERFKPVPEYIGLTLSEARELGIAEDLELNKRLRKRHPYNPEQPDKRKGVLIQAVEAIDNRMKREEAERLQEQQEQPEAADID